MASCGCAASTEYKSVIQPNTVESIVTYLPTGQGGAQEKWEYARYSDNPQFWTGLSTPQDVVTHVDGNEPTRVQLTYRLGIGFDRTCAPACGCGRATSGRFGTPFG